MIPEFAILGHPNEGKSSVLSTLAEDDSVKISPTPGETTRCRTFPVKIDGHEIIRFTDTPGFQNPNRLLHTLSRDTGPAETLLERFVEENKENQELRHDCELLKPLIRGAGIIYVADGSRPLRNVDLAEMELLRLSGKPRMAILNCKDNENAFLSDWKAAFRRHFNSSRVFNAHNATYRERLRLLEALKAIEQDWHEVLNYVVESVKSDWQQRNTATADILCRMLKTSQTYTLSAHTTKESAIEKEKEKLQARYSNDIRKLEKSAHQQIRQLYKHNIFDYQLPAQSMYHHDLFAKKTWQLLGLKQRQLAVAGAVSGAALAAAVDIAAGGASLGLFTTAGGILGAVGAVYGAKNLADSIKVFGFSAGKFTIQVGPNENPQFPFILLDRALIYYRHIINWTHGRRNYQEKPEVEPVESITSSLSSDTVRKLAKYFHLLEKELSKAEEYEYIFKRELITIFETLLNSEDHERDTADGENTGKTLA